MAPSIRIVEQFLLATVVRRAAIRNSGSPPCRERCLMRSEKIRPFLILAAAFLVIFVLFLGRRVPEERPQQEMAPLVRVTTAAAAPYQANAQAARDAAAGHAAQATAISAQMEGAAQQQSMVQSFAGRVADLRAQHDHVSPDDIDADSRTSLRDAIETFERNFRYGSVNDPFDGSLD